VEFRVLGSLEVVGAGGPVELQGAKERAVLAYLLAHLGRSASVDEIIHAVWGERPPASAARSLQARVSKLRRLLEPGRTAASGSVVVRDTSGYRLVIDGGDVDAERFARLVADARGVEPEESLAKAEAALRLLRGEPYGEFAYHDFAQPEIRRLKELELQARELRLGALLALGRHAEALPDLERLVEENPLREPLARLLMLAFYRSGRHTDALAVYRGLARELRELGLEPDEDSRRLERQMLQHAPALAAASELRTNLGSRLTSFVGREDERSRVLSLLADRRLVTLTGPGGVGKTSLAVEAARAVVEDYPDGVWLVELASLRDPARVPEAVAEALGMRTTDFDGQQSSGLGFLESHLRRRELLLVLDNCEHLTAAAGELAASLLSACPGVRLLATSREPLAAPGEAVFDVAPLELPARDAAPGELERAAAVRLFVERARAVRNDLELDAETLHAIAEVCERLDGIPLALELAAARTRTLSPREIAERLADRFALLSRGPERLSARQRTLAGVVEWSYQLLGEQEQTLFRRLSVFPSSFGLEAAEEVCASDDLAASQVADLLASLVDRSMVTAGRRGADRFRLLETLREFGRAQAESRDERLAVARRHALWAMRIAEEGHARVWVEGLEAGTRAFVPRRADFEAGADLAFELGDADLALALTSALGTLGFLFSCGSDDRKRVEAALALPGGALERRLRCMRALAVLLIREGRPRDAVEVGRNGLRIAEQADDEAEVARMRTVTFQARLAAGDPDVATEELEPVEEYAVRAGERWYEGMLHHYRGVAAFTSGDVAEARTRAELALEAFGASGDLWGIVNASDILGHSLAAVGEYDGAMRVYEQALAAGVRGLQEEAVPLLYHYGLSRLRAGDEEAAATLFSECARLAERESPYLRWHSAMGAAHLALRRGNRGLAERVFGDALELVREAVADGLDTRTVRVAVVVTLRELGHLAEERGDVERARRLQEEGLDWARRVGEPRLLARTLEGLAGALSLGDHAGEGARLLGLAEATRAATRVRLPEAEGLDLERVSTRLRERLGDELFEAALARGRADYLSQLDTSPAPWA
jgi:predicted ATPase/DNA-binding SARP family transcriptional activator